MISFEEFIEKVCDYLESCGINSEPRVRNDRENGRYIAKVCGMWISVRHSGGIATIRQGCHQYMAYL